MSAAAQPAPATASNATDTRQAASTKPVAELSWDELAIRAPDMAATMRSYLEQLTVSSRPSTVAAASLALPGGKVTISFTGRSGHPACAAIG